MAKNKHLTLSERIRLERSLGESCSFRSIARLLDKHPSTISKEVKGRIVFKKTGCFGHAFNECRLRRSCSLDHLCADPACSKNSCRDCARCFRFCSYFSKEECPRLASPPYVCNGCPGRTKCTLEKRLYSARAAQQEYELVRSESRSGVSLSEEEAIQLDALLSPLILQGQSIHHICASRPDLVMRSEKTIYNYVDAGILTAKNLDLPRKVSYRPRKRSQPYKVDKRCRVGRTYDDFAAFLAERPDTPVVQMDSVEGHKGEPVLLTLHFVETQLMLAFLRGANTSESVIQIIDRLYLQLGPEWFPRLFPVLLADNGGEFSNPAAMEFDQQGNPRSRLFYCDPRAPWQKGAAENNHELIRRVLPKGTSFKSLTQEKVDLMMRHINSYRRKKLGDHSPYEVFRSFHGEEILTRLAVEPVPSQEIILLPCLLS